MKQNCCSEENKGVYGWNALYDICRTATLEAGAILCYVPKPNKMVIFELDEDVDLFNDGFIEALPGSAIANDFNGDGWSAIGNDFNGDGWYADDPVARVPLAMCRFPTKKELEEYEKSGSV